MSRTIGYIVLLSLGACAVFAETEFAARKPIFTEPDERIANFNKQILQIFQHAFSTISSAGSNTKTNTDNEIMATIITLITVLGESIEEAYKFFRKDPENHHLPTGIEEAIKGLSKIREFLEEVEFTGSQEPDSQPQPVPRKMVGRKLNRLLTLF